MLVLDVDGESGAALAHILQAGLAGVLILTLLLARCSPLRALIYVHTLLAVRAQPQTSPNQATHHPLESIWYREDMGKKIKYTAKLCSANTSLLSKGGNAFAVRYIP